MPQKSNVVGGAPAPGSPGVAGAEQAIDPSFAAARASLRPDDHLMLGTVLGHYRIGAPTGSMTTLAAGVLIYSFRYGDPGTIALLKRIQVYAAVTTTFAAPQILDVDAIVVRAWTTNDTGGTAVVTTGNSGKLRTNMGTSRIATNGDIRIATAAAVAAGATKTPDPNPFGYGAITGMSGSTTTPSDVGAGGYMGDVYKLDATNQHPMIFAANEGFNLRIVTTQGAAGVVKYYVVTEWAELLGF